MNISSSNGRIRLDSIIVNDDVTLSTSNGEILVQDVIGFYELVASTSNGRIVLEDVAFSKYDLGTSNGEINLENLNVDNKDATLKRFYKEKTQVRLQPSNQNYHPIYSNNCKIQAVVLGLVRKF